MEIVAVPAFTDNYIWLVHDEPSGETAVVDPGDAAPALAEAQRRGWPSTRSGTPTIIGIIPAATRDEGGDRLRRLRPRCRTDPGPRHRSFRGKRAAYRRSCRVE